MSIIKNSFLFQDANQSTGFLLWQVTNLWQREIKLALNKHQLTHAQFVLIASIYWLSLHNQVITQIVLSKHTKIDPMTTSTVLRSLAQKGLISRQENLTDTRAKTIALTPEGIQMAKITIPLVENFDRDFFGKLNHGVTDFNQSLLELLK